uniref:C2HC/C3H-type domain-containing protein n=1 Tax=Amblyomma aureolatum TaxID=187763 RepID=A0A1E1XDT6_9ACAR
MSASRLEQMRSQFQQNLQIRSGLPRPTRIPGPTSPAAKTTAAAKQAATPPSSRVNGHGPTAAPSPASPTPRANGNGKLQNGSAHKDVSVIRNGQHNGTPRPLTNGTSQARAPVSNGLRPQVASTQQTLPPVVKGGVLMTMTTTQLRQLSNGHQSSCGSLKPAAKPTSTPPVRTVATVVRTSAIPSNRAVTTKPAPKAVYVDQPKKPATAMARQARTTNGTTSSPLRTPVAAKASVPPEARPLGPDQERCDICGRGFNKDRIEKHRTICQKAATKKVKVFDATKMRTKGTEAESFVKKGFHKKEVPVKKANWRAKHEEFLKAVRQARMVQEHLAAGGKLSDLPPPPPSENPDYVQCPKCLRKFNETAAERHIPRCNLAPKTTTGKPAATLNGRK